MEREKQYGFNLVDSISRAIHSGGMLKGYKIHVTKSVKPEPTQMKGICIRIEKDLNIPPGHIFSYLALAVWLVFCKLRHITFNAQALMDMIYLYLQYRHQLMIPPLHSCHKLSRHHIFRSVPFCFQI